MHKSFNWESMSFDWNHVRSFLAAVDQGSLSGAARVLGQTQPTVSRQITALEQSLGVLLLERGAHGLTLTEPGKGLLDHVSAMGQAAMNLSLTASGQADSIEGQVCITSTNVFATFHLPPILRRLRTEAPLIHINVVASNDVRDITAREADISIRHAKPTEPDLIGKHVGDTEAYLYASKELLNNVGRPDTASDCEALDFIGFESAQTLLPILQSFGINLTEQHFKITTASGTAILEYVRQGLGVSILTGDAEMLYPELERVLPEMAAIPVPIWLVTHRELRTSRRIRVVFDILAEDLAARFKKL
jgi:DNA-binding transcriptional LysR family regulator